MKTVMITRRLEVDYGHRLLGHEGKCRNAHGHRGVFEIGVVADALDDCGRVIDFGLVKQLVGGWLDSHLDHGFVVQRGDPLEACLLEHRLLVLDVPPSIEHLTRLVFDAASRLLGPMGLSVVHVRGYETPSCWADLYAEPGAPLAQATAVTVLATMPGGAS